MLRLTQTFQKISFGSKSFSDLIGKEVYEALGLRQPPEKPLRPYLKFYSENKQKLPISSPASRLCKERWGALSDEEKQRFTEKYKQDRLKYRDQMKEYSNSLSDVEKLKLKIYALEKLLSSATKKYKIAVKNEKVSLHAPKKPLNPFHRFIKDHYVPGLKFPVASMAKDWRALGEEGQRPYYNAFQKDHEVFRREYQQWKEKMLDEGRTHLFHETNNVTPSFTKQAQKLQTTKKQKT